MIVTELTSQCLKSRRFAKRMKALGYREHETDWEIIRGGRYREVILDVQISPSGKTVWTKVGEKG